jgi:hypothetical protein
MADEHRMIDEFRHATSRDARRAETHDERTDEDGMSMVRMAAGRI